MGHASLPAAQQNPPSELLRTCRGPAATTTAVRFPNALHRGLPSASTRPAHVGCLPPQPDVLRETGTPAPRIPREGAGTQAGAHTPRASSRSPWRQDVGRAAQARAPAHLHGVQGEVAGDLELLPEDLLLDVIDAHELGHPSREDALAVRRVAQSSEGPEQRGTHTRSPPGTPSVWRSLKGQQASSAGLWPGAHKAPRQQAPQEGTSQRTWPFHKRTAWLQSRCFLAEVRRKRRPPCLSPARQPRAGGPPRPCIPGNQVPTGLATGDDCPTHQRARPTEEKINTFTLENTPEKAKRTHRAEKRFPRDRSVGELLSRIHTQLEKHTIKTNKCPGQTLLQTRRPDGRLACKNVFDSIGP